MTECAAVCPEANAFPGSGTLYNQEQADGWKKVVDAVHEKGGKIFIQIFHGGRSVHPDYVDGLTPISSSAVAINGTVHTQNGRVPHVEPKAATLEDIQKVIKEFKKSAELAKAAGFDGVEVHGANGYLLD